MEKFFKPITWNKTDSEYKGEVIGFSSCLDYSITNNSEKVFEAWYIEEGAYGWVDTIHLGFFSSLEEAKAYCEIHKTEELSIILQKTITDEAWLYISSFQK